MPCFQCRLGQKEQLQGSPRAVVRPRPGPTAHCSSQGECQTRAAIQRRVRPFLPPAERVFTAACDLALPLPPAAIRPRSKLRRRLVISREVASHCSQGPGGGCSGGSGTREQ